MQCWHGKGAFGPIVQHRHWQWASPPPKDSALFFTDMPKSLIAQNINPSPIPITQHRKNMSVKAMPNTCIGVRSGYIGSSAWVGRKEILWRPALDNITK